MRRCDGVMTVFELTMPRADIDETGIFVAAIVVSAQAEINCQECGMLE